MRNTTKYYNGTPHDICFYNKEQVSYDKATRKYYLLDESQTPYFVIPKREGENQLLNVVWAETTNPCITEEGVSIKNKEVTSITPIPEGYEFVVCSAIFANGAKYVGDPCADRLLTTCDPIYLKNGAVVGCLSLMYTT